MKTKWLDNTLISGPYLCLCLSQQEMESALRHCGIKEYVPFINNCSDATTHFFTNDDGKLMTIVCLGETEKVHPIQVASMLVHEAVHVFQEYCNQIGEKEPSSEFEAYSIQSISQALMFEYERRIKK